MGAVCVGIKRRAAEGEAGEDKRVREAGDAGDASRDLEINEFKENVEADGGEYEVNDEMHGPEWGEFSDERTGRPLDPKMVREARSEELEFTRRIPLYDKVLISECWNKAGKAPASTKWVDVDKGAEGCPGVRSRLVARDVRPKGERDREDLFAATPPLEAKKLLFWMAANQVGAEPGQPVKLMFIDVEKAHLNGVVGDERACVELPDEDAEPGVCGRLNRWLYGTRPAASAWEKDYADRLEAIGFRKGMAAPTVFLNS